MKFKDKTSEQEYQLVHPDTKLAIELFDSWSQSESLPEPVITDVCHTAEEMVSIYGQNGKTKFSWHRIEHMCAVDLRTSHYTQEELSRVEQYLKDKYYRPRWELITKLHGTGPHIHLARRDSNYKPKPRVS